MVKKGGSTIKINEKEDIAFLLKGCIFLDWVFPFMVFGTQYNANLGYNLILWILMGIAVMGLTIWGVVLNNATKHNFMPKIFALYFGVSLLFYSLDFFLIFYEAVYI